LFKKNSKLSVSICIYQLIYITYKNEAYENKI
jgi:hypothetical protein